MEKVPTPKTYNEALALRDSTFWKESIYYEMDSLMSNGTQILVDPPPIGKPTIYKWVFRIKDGKVLK